MAGKVEARSEVEERVESERERRWLEWCARVYRKRLAEGAVMRDESRGVERMVR